MCVQLKICAKVGAMEITNIAVLLSLLGVCDILCRVCFKDFWKNSY